MRALDCLAAMLASFGFVMLALWAAGFAGGVV